MRFLQPAGCIAAVAACLLLAGCVGYGHALRNVDLALRQGRPADALATLEQLDGGSRNQVLYYINKGMLLRMNGDIAGSIAAFEAAKPLMTFQEATSISETAGQLALVESASSYQPRAFERLQLHVLQALNHLQAGHWDDARVEALQIDLLLRRLHDGEAPDGADAFARYLSGIIFEGMQEYDEALIAYRKALEAYDRNGTVAGVPDDLEQRLLLLTYRLGLGDEHAKYLERFGDAQGARAKALAETAGGELILVATSGLVARRYEVSSVQQDFTTGKFYRISLPALRRRAGSARRFVLMEGDREIGRSQAVENLSVAAARALEDELPGLIARAIARNVIKNRLANEAGEESAGMEFLINFASVMLENADVRSWSTLPDTIHLLRVPLPEGTHRLAVEIEGGGATGSRELGTVNIDAFRPTVVGLHWIQ
ncbi:MAG TPA: hypothetical protein VF267_13000 [Gammaproteobacteria bacterium]